MGLNVTKHLISISKAFGSTTNHKSLKNQQNSNRLLESFRVSSTCASRLVLVVNNQTWRPQHSHGAGPRRIRSFRKNGSFPGSHQLVQVLFVIASSAFIQAHSCANALRTERLGNGQGGYAIVHSDSWVVAVSVQAGEAGQKGISSNTPFLVVTHGPLISQLWQHGS